MGLMWQRSSSENVSRWASKMSTFPWSTTRALRLLTWPTTTNAQRLQPCWRGACSSSIGSSSHSSVCQLPHENLDLVAQNCEGAVQVIVAVIFRHVGRCAGCRMKATPHELHAVSFTF